MFLYEPENVDTDGICNALDDIQLGWCRHIVWDNGILTEAIYLISGCVSIRDDEVSNKIQPGLAQLWDLFECMQVCLGSNWKIGFPLGQWRGSIFFEEEPRSTSQYPHSGRDANNNNRGLQISGTGWVGVKSVCGAQGNEKGESISNALKPKGSVTKSVPLKHLLRLIGLFGELACLKRCFYRNRFRCVTRKMSERWRPESHTQIERKDYFSPVSTFISKGNAVFTSQDVNADCRFILWPAF